MIMRTILFLFTILAVGHLMAGEGKYPEFPSIELISKKANPDLKVGKSEVVFEITGIHEIGFSKPIVWSVDKDIDTTWVNDAHEIRKTIKSGKHDFKFYYSSRYKEIITGKMEFESGYTYEYRLNFKDTERNQQVKKPVIYLYPEEPTEVTLNVHPVGEMIFTYPILPEEGWKFTAHPDGKIDYNGNKYNYLFWEAEQKMDYKNFSVGFFIEGNKSLEFLEEKLTKMGFNSQEKADMITFWGPQMQEHPICFVHFIFNEACDQFATFDIHPKPDHVNRVYLTFTGMDTIPFNMVNTEQDLPIMQRDGFSVLEWGGVEILPYDL